MFHRYCRKLKKSQSEAFASLASDALPFIEYELHRRLHIKVKVNINILYPVQFIA